MPLFERPWDGGNIYGISSTRPTALRLSTMVPAALPLSMGSSRLFAA
jgi:hypothetical protein